MAKATKTKKPTGLVRMAQIDIEMLRQISPSIAQSVYALYRELGRTRHELNDAKKSEKAAWGENIRFKSDADAANSQIEVLDRIISGQNNKFKEIFGEYKTIKLEKERLELSNAVTQSSFLILMESLERMHEKVAQKYIETIPETVRRRMMNDLELLIAQVNTIMQSRGVAPALPTPQPVPTPE